MNSSLLRYYMDKLRPLIYSFYYMFTVGAIYNCPDQTVNKRLSPLNKNVTVLASLRERDVKISR